MPIIVPVTPAPTPGTLGFSWVDLFGNEHDLTYRTSPGAFVAIGSTGLGSQPVDLTLEKLPYNPGSALRHIGRQPARLEIPIAVSQPTFADFLATVESLRGWFDTGDEQAFRAGYFRVYRPDNTVREIRAFYAGGFEGDLTNVHGGTGTFVVSLIAPDGTAQATSDTVYIFDQAAVGVQVGVTNPGELLSYPIWTVTGPARGTGVVNSTTGRSWALSANGGLLIGPGGSVTVDCRPASQRETLPVIDGSGDSKYAYMTAESSITTNVVVPGLNNLGINADTMSGATRFQVAFRPRYRGLL